MYRGRDWYPKLARVLKDQGAAEVVVALDDGSSPELVRAEMGAVPGLKVVQTAGRTGRGGACNAAVAAATQPWLAFLDHDDWWDDGFLRQIMRRADGSVLAYDNHRWADQPDGLEPLGDSVFARAGWKSDRLELPDTSWFAHGFPMLKLVLPRETFERVGRYRQLKKVEDYDLFWRLLAQGETIEFVRDPKGNYVVGRVGSMTETAKTSPSGYRDGQRSWIAVWGGIARSRAMPPKVRVVAAYRAARAAARLAASRLLKSR